MRHCGHCSPARVGSACADHQWTLGITEREYTKVGVGYELSLSALRVDRSNATRRNVDQDSKRNTENCEKFLDQLRIKISRVELLQTVPIWTTVSSALWWRSKYQDKWENDRERCIELKTEQGDTVPKDERKKKLLGVEPTKGEAQFLNGIKERVMATTRGAEKPMTTARQSVGELDRPRHVTESVRRIRHSCCRTLLISTTKRRRVHHSVESKAENVKRPNLKSEINSSIMRLQKRNETQRRNEKDTGKSQSQGCHFQAFLSTKATPLKLTE